MAAARIDTRLFLFLLFRFAGVKGLIVIPGSLWGNRGLSYDCRITDFLEVGVRDQRGDSRCRTMLRGVRGESKRVNLRRRREAIGELVGEDSVSGAKPQSLVARAGEPASRRRLRASFSGEGDERSSHKTGRTS